MSCSTSIPTFERNRWWVATKTWSPTGTNSCGSREILSKTSSQPLKPASHLLGATVGCGIRKLSDLHDHDIGVKKLPVLGRVADVSSRRSLLQKRGCSDVEALCDLHVLLRHRLRLKSHRFESGGNIWVAHDRSDDLAA